MQTTALLLDSLRMLRSRKLFWISLGISLLVMLAYASVGFGDNGLSLFFGAWELEDPFFVKGSPWAKALYLGIFSNLVVTIWLSWAATILALVSTSSVFPDFMSAGSIEMVLSKPISRVRVFLIKFLGSLLFVFVQVLLFCTGVFFCVGFRIDEWIWPIFAAVPLVTIFFSYLYAFNVLMGLVTRSGLAALLFTALFWFLLFAVQAGEGGLSSVATEQAVRLERIEERMAEQETRLSRLATSERPSEQRARERLETEFEANRARADEARQRLEAIERWHRPLEIAMAVLPKNQQTIGLLDRWLAPDSRYTMTEIMLGEYREEEASESPPAELEEAGDGDDREARRAERRADRRESARRELGEDRETSPWFIVGSSLAFEAVILGLAAFIFARRDF
jgi:ABC-type transport system involved in multi-copper enzyme maturation permease subunit